MSFQDRDYNRASPLNYATPTRPTAQMRMWSITIWLIAINVVVFAIDSMTRGVLATWGYFSVDTAFGHLQLWRVLTFQFLHADVGHIFFNMLSLYFFGPIVESYLGRKRFLAFYLLCGVSGALGYLVLWRLGLVIASSMTPLIGASAGVFGVLIGCAMIAPNITVRLLFPPIPMRMKTLAWCFIGFAVLTILSHGNNAGGEAAHLGGALVGWGLMSNPKLLSVFDPSRKTNRFWKPGDSENQFFR